MKKVTITCDTCKKVLEDQYITLGSNTGTNLFYENKLPSKPRRTNFLGRFRDLHLCSSHHFIKYFFDRDFE